MKHPRYVILFIMSLYAYQPLQGCILRNIINNSTRCSIIIRSVVIPGLEKTRDKNIVPPRPASSLTPRIVNTGKMGLGVTQMRVLVQSSGALGATCKKYLIEVHEDAQQITLKRKDGCSIGLLEYTPVGYPVSIDPNRCYIDMYLYDDVNSLYLNVVADPNEPIELIRNIVEEQRQKKFGPERFDESAGLTQEEVKELEEAGIEEDAGARKSRFPL